MFASRRLAVLILGLSALLAACGGGASGSSGASAPTGPPAPKITVTPSNGSAAVRPDTVVTVKAASGRLGQVTVTTPDGRQVAGMMAKDGSEWTSDGGLDLGTHYSVSARATGPGGSAAASTTFTTLKGDKLGIADMAPGDGQTVGVGMPIILKFDHGVAEPQQVNFVSHLKVTSTPPMDGAWHWWTLQELHFRPEQYWPAHATVTLHIDLKGVDAGNNVWGTDELTRTFVIGDQHITYIDDATHQMTVTNNGQTIATYPVSLGKAGFPTLSGTLWVRYKLQVLKMSSCAAFGGAACVPGNANYYDENVYWDTAVSTDGYYIHAAPWSVGAQGNTDVSHGCINLSTERATTFFNFSLEGDVVIIKNTAKQATEDDGEGDWQTPFAQYANSGPGKP